MLDSNLSLERCTELGSWDNLVADSPQGSIFCQSLFLNALEVEYDLWLVLRAGQPELGAVLFRRGDEVLPAPYPFTMYQGMFFTQAVATLPYHNRFRKIPAILDFVLGELSTHYNRLSFCMHYNMEDIRGLQWFHYHEPDQGRFRIDLNYTGLIDLQAPNNFDAYVATIRKKNRQHYRRAMRDDLSVEVSDDVDTLDHLHNLTFKRQGLGRQDRNANLLRSITATALSGGFGELLVCSDGDGEALAATLFIRDEECGYSIFAGNNPTYNLKNAGTVLLLENIRRCMDRGLKRVDMCGINSPNRGDFKTSFNALPVPYFTATWERP